MNLRDRLRERHGGDGAACYRMRERLVSIGDDYWIEDEAGRRVVKVNGKALRIRTTLDFEDARGATLLRIQERKLRLRDTMEIEDADGRTVATVQKKALPVLRERMSVSVKGGPDLDVHGHILDHEYEIEADRRRVAEVSKRWFRIADTYGVEIAPGQNDVLLLAVTAAIDAMTDD
jgi:uncharacterized protein YxjI